MGRRSFGSTFFLILSRLKPYRVPVVLGVCSLLVVNILELAMPEILARVVDLLVGQARPNELFRWAGIYFVLATVQSVFRIAWRVWLIRSSILAATDLRIQFFDALKRLKYEFFERRTPGEVMSLAVSDSESVRMCLGPGILMAVDSLFFLTLVPIALWRISPQWTLWALGPMLLLPVAVYLHQERLQKLYLQGQSRLDALTTLASETVSQLMSTRVLGVERTQRDRIQKASESYRNDAWRLHVWHTLLSPALEVVLSFGIVASIYLATRSFEHSGVAHLGAFVAFQRYLQKLIWPITAVAYVLNQVQRGVGSERRLREVVEGEKEVDRDSDPTVAVQSGGLALEVRDLTFHYRDDEAPVLHHLNLTVSHGERVAILGSIGSGKTTLLMLLTRVYDPPRGAVFVQGRDVLDWSLQSLRTEWATLTQEAFVFSPDLKSNLVLGKPSGSEIASTDSALALQFAELLGELSEDREVQPSGRDLSGGQRQRIAIARGFMQAAPGWLIDDALSAVDPVREERILEKWITSKSTVIYVTHRETALHTMDRVYELTGGKLVEITERYRSPQTTHTAVSDSPVSHLARALG